jgi:CheY-like chemotaxis protein/tRNA A-37 threonylcarbamoyl transferase component Bud32
MCGQSGRHWLLEIHMRKILIIEENTMFQKIFQNLLMSRGFEVLVAGSFEECDKRLKEMTPDLVLVNPIISSGRGVELMERIRGPKAGISGIPMLVISSKDDVVMKTNAQRLGAIEFLVKHLAPPRVVVKKIEELLQHRPPAPAHALDPRALKVGDILDNRYEILDRLGKGGQGAVFKAYDKVLTEEVALKILILNPELAEELMESFLKEVRLSRKISHQNVVRVYDIGKSGGVHYITMEFVKGSDLNRYLFDNWPVAFEKLREIFIQVAAALKSAHDMGIVHRDIKPHNVLVMANGTAKVADFGIASIAGAMLKSTEELSMGTPDYMAPELAQADTNLADRRIDIYSLGIMMYEAFTGVLPYEGDTFMERLQGHLEGNPRPPRDMNPDFPVDLEKIILTCMHREPAIRFQEMSEVIASLKAIIL